jgi:mono/diheme cytochrome c family protein
VKRLGSTGAAVFAASLAVLCAQTRAAPSSTARPLLGAAIAPFPNGPGKEIADKACLNCHAPDIVRQQRLTEKQWTANVTKMVGWGAELPENQREKLIRYLAANFGPANRAFQPVVVQPNRPR